MGQGAVPISVKLLRLHVVLGELSLAVRKHEGDGRHSGYQQCQHRITVSGKAAVKRLTGI